jgi:aldose 1-epimerase
VPAARVVAVDADLLPVAVHAVDGTPFDLRRGPALADVLDGVDIDHCLFLEGNPAAILTDPVTGRRLTVDTDQPAIQVYGGGMLPSRHAAVALEPEIAPDGPNRPDLDLGPRGVLAPGDVYRHVTTITLDTI